MSGSRRSHCPGVLDPSRAPPSSHPGYHHHHHHPQRRPHRMQRQQRLRNPWVAHESHSTSSSSGRTHHKTRPMDAPAPIRIDHSMAPQFLQPTFYGLAPSAPPLPPEVPLLQPQPHSIPSVVPAHPHHSLPGGDSASTPTAPGSSNSRCDGAGDGVGAGAEGTSGGWSGGGCGGQCPALDDFCFHCLRVAFVAGTATGVGLVIAGAVLRLRLMVLVYIGGLTAFVSLILLGVHCCVRRDDALRRRRLRELQKRRRGRECYEAGDGDFSGGQEGIPLRELGPTQHQQQQHHSSRVGSSVGSSTHYHGLVLQPPPPPAAFRKEQERAHCRWPLPQTVPVASLLQPARSTLVVEPNIGGQSEELEIISQTGASLWRQSEANRAEVMETHY